MAMLNNQMVVLICWLVVSNMTGLFSISYMGCHPSPIDELIFFKMVKTTNQLYVLPV